MIRQDQQIVLLAGLPRTGSTLLQNILAQNPAFHLEGNSGLCQVMWDAKISCEHHAAQQLTGVGKDVSFKEDLLRGIPKTYYENANGRVVFDKCRRWVNKENIAVARQYIDKKIKSIVMVRPLEEIAASFKRVSDTNNLGVSLEDLLSPRGDLAADFGATMYAFQSKDPSYLFVSYDDLVGKTESVLRRIYSHIEQPLFAHDTHKVKQVVFEDDERNNMAGMHDIRPQVAKKSNEVVLPDWALAICQDMTSAMLSEIDKVSLWKARQVA
mgnify:CR=1 FL=1